MKREITRKQIAVLTALVAKEQASIKQLADYYDSMGREDRRNTAIVRLVDIDVLRDALTTFKSGVILTDQEVFQ